MKKIKRLPQLFKITVLLNVLLFISCSKENDTNLIGENSFLPKVENGRLVFENSKQYNEFINNQSAIDNLKKEIKNFTSLRNHIQENEIGYAGFILDLYNKNREIQIGSNVIYINNWVQYLVKNNDQILLKKIKENILKGKKVTYSNVTIFNIARKSIPIKITNNKNDNIQKRWLDARYQREVNTNGRFATMKFVFEAYLNTTYYMSGPFTFALGIDTGVRSKYEWLHGNTWKPAGEIIVKEISNLNIRLTNTSTGIHVEKRVSYTKQVNNGNLIISAPRFNAIPGNLNYKLEITGKFKSVDPTKPQTLFFNHRFEYEENCSWTAYFVI